jgi:hypothetical protein
MFAEALFWSVGFWLVSDVAGKVMVFFGFASKSSSFFLRFRDTADWGFSMCVSVGTGAVDF